MAYTATILPYRVCFVETINTFYYYFDIGVNCVFGVDIIISFFSALYDDDGILITNNKIIALRYLKSWFLIDIVSV